MDKKQSKEENPFEMINKELHVRTTERRNCFTMRVSPGK